MRGEDPRPGNRDEVPRQSTSSGCASTRTRCGRPTPTTAPTRTRCCSATFPAAVRRRRRGAAAAWCSPACRTTSSRTRRRTPCSTACTAAITSRATPTCWRSTRRSPTSWRCSSTSRSPRCCATRSPARAATCATGNLLAELAQQFGQALEPLDGAARARSAVGSGAVTNYADARRSRTTRGAILVAAVFDAFLTIYQRRIDDLLRIATGGTGVLQPGALHPDLVDRLADEAARRPRTCSNICIRALDYCPPVDITFARLSARADHRRRRSRRRRRARLPRGVRRGVPARAASTRTTCARCRWRACAGRRRGSRAASPNSARAEFLDVEFSREARSWTRQ